MKDQRSAPSSNLSAQPENATSLANAEYSPHVAPAGSTVVVGMSGGVDSSVTALLLKQQGYRVKGIFMKNWDETRPEQVSQCSAAEDFDDVAKVCEAIDIPYYSFNFVKEYREHVFADFIKALKKGHTPNPDILCNREIKFQRFLENALQLGADYLATGHYAQILVNKQTGRKELHKGIDNNKDQTYFIYTLQDKLLDRILFPIGHLPKSEVRKIALAHHLATSTKKDSTGICFIGERDFPEFIKEYIRPKSGPFKTLDKKIVGMHQGSSFYTIGQRRGLGLGGAGESWFVVDKDPQKNIVYVVRGGEHPALYYPALLANEASWVNEVPSAGTRCSAKIRYRQEDQLCTIESIDSNGLIVRFDSPQRAITPGQSIVFYQGSRCLGGAFIQQARD